jgi:hypothetical protein
MRDLLANGHLYVLEIGSIIILALYILKLIRNEWPW